MLECVVEVEDVKWVNNLSPRTRITDDCAGSLGRYFVLAGAPRYARSTLPTGHALLVKLKYPDGYHFR